MIPKVIHYCWFGKNSYPKLVKKCIKSWKKFCPDYEFVEWNEDNFDINCNTYVKEAFEAKKWAFVTDYVRLFVLYNFGGIYMDTDVEIIKNIDEFLKYPAFSGFENENMIPTAIMGAHKHNNWIKHLLDYYNNRHFIMPDGSMDLTTNVKTITSLTKKVYKIELNNSIQNVENEFILFPSCYFCPKSYYTEKISLTDKTYTIHHFNSSWYSKPMRQEKKRQIRYRKLFGEKLGNKALQFTAMYKRKDGSLKYAIMHFLKRKLKI